MERLDAELLDLCLDELTILPTKFVCKRWYAALKTRKVNEYMFKVGCSYPTSSFLEWLSTRWMITGIDRGAASSGNMSMLRWCSMLVPLDISIYGYAANIPTLEWLEANGAIKPPMYGHKAIIQLFAERCTMEMVNWASRHLNMVRGYVLQICAQNGRRDIVREMLEDKNYTRSNQYSTSDR